MERKKIFLLASAIISVLISISVLEGFIGGLIRGVYPIFLAMFFSLMEALAAVAFSLCITNIYFAYVKMNSKKLITALKIIGFAALLAYFAIWIRVFMDFNVMFILKIVTQLVIILIVDKVILSKPTAELKALFVLCCVVNISVTVIEYIVGSQMVFSITAINVIMEVLLYLLLILSSNKSLGASKKIKASASD